jgi:hypothetical protein
LLDLTAYPHEVRTHWQSPATELHAAHAGIHKHTVSTHPLLLQRQVSLLYFTHCPYPVAAGPTLLEVPVQIPRMDDLTGNCMHSFAG